MEDAQISRKAHACMWIACKFEGCRHICFREILALDQAHALTMGKVRDAEWEVLEGINYEVPFDNTYAAMVREFDCREDAVKNDRQLATQCLAFYSQAIRFSRDFVLDSQLGPEIIRCVVEKRTSNARITWACALIRRKHNPLKICPAAQS